MINVKSNDAREGEALAAGDGSAGIDRAEELNALDRPIPGIRTNRIDRIAPLVQVGQR